jgi:hypothetical protein
MLRHFWCENIYIYIYIYIKGAVNFNYSEDILFYFVLDVSAYIKASIAYQFKGT